MSVYLSGWYPHPRTGRCGEVRAMKVGHPPKGTTRMNLNVPSKLHNAFKAACAAQGERMTDVLLQFIEHYARQNPPRPLSKGSR